MSGSTLEVLVDSTVSNGQVLIMRSDTACGGGVPVHVRQREDEIFLLLNGALTVWAGDQRRELSGGGVAVLPQGVPHTYFVTSQTATILQVIAPGGLEQAFREAGWDLRAPPPDGWACTPDAVGAAMAKVGCAILGPPPGSARDNPIATGLACRCLGRRLSAVCYVSDSTHTISKSARPGPAQVRWVCDLGCPSSVMRPERFRT
jgi:quercetin dioxygenase-like cupin family protein